MKASKRAITKGRHHYLRSVQPADMQALIDAKISDDYTMGYADVAGFRLGCCRPVQWINPHTKEVTALTLHPLTAMDASLMRSDYMNLSINEALAYVIHLLEQTKKHHGEVVLLWHNTSLEINDPNNQRVLYEQIINYLKS